MRIVTWNIYGMQGYPAEVAAPVLGPIGSDQHLDHYAGVLESLQADIIALQEGVAQPVARDLARRMQCHLATAPSPTAFPGHILSRWPVVESRIFSHVDAREEVPPFSRTGSASLLQIAEDLQCWIVCVHLHPGDVKMRQREADRLRPRLEAFLAICPHAVVLGDFNCAMEEGGIHNHLAELDFTNAMLHAGGGLQLTMDTEGIRPWKIDHIYLSSALAPTLHTAAVIREAGFRTDPPRPEGQWDASDHLPVRADLDWPV